MLETLLTAYGYPILLVGTFFEGETIMILGGLAAHLGYLSLGGVIACGFFGTLLGDQLSFFIGRRHSKNLLVRRARWQGRADRVFRLLERHQNLLIVGFRFFYGFRFVTPVVIGMSGVSFWRFLVLNLTGAALWAVAVAFAGYYFGRAVESMLGDVKRYEIALMAGMLAVAGLVWLVYLYRRRSGSESNAP